MNLGAIGITEAVGITENHFRVNRYSSGTPSGSGASGNPIFQIIPYYHILSKKPKKQKPKKTKNQKRPKTQKTAETLKCPIRAVPVRAVPVRVWFGPFFRFGRFRFVRSVMILCGSPVRFAHSSDRRFRFGSWAKIMETSWRIHGQCIENPLKNR